MPVAGILPEDPLGAEAAHGPGQAVLQEHAHQRHRLLHALAGEGAGALADPLVERVVEPFVLLFLHLVHDHPLDFLGIGRHLEAKLGDLEEYDLLEHPAVDGRGDAGQFLDAGDAPALAGGEAVLVAVVGKDHLLAAVGGRPCAFLVEAEALAHLVVDAVEQEEQVGGLAAEQGAGAAQHVVDGVDHQLEGIGDVGALGLRLVDLVEDCQLEKARHVLVDVAGERPLLERAVLPELLAAGPQRRSSRWLALTSSWRSHLRDLARFLHDAGRGFAAALGAAVDALGLGLDDLLGDRVLDARPAWCRAWPGRACPGLPSRFRRRR